MDISIVTEMPVKVEEKFRTPSAVERRMGLWVDRIGQRHAESHKPHLRYLGQYAAVMVMRGRGRFFSPTSGQVDLHAGDMVLLFPDEPTWYHSVGPWDEYWIVWHGPDAIALEDLGYLDRRSAVLRGPAEIGRQAHRRLTEIIDSEDRAAVLERKTVVLRMILELYRVGGRAGAHRDEVIEAAMRFISQHLCDELRVDALAERFNVSEAHFRRRFKRCTGQGPRRFITHLRITRAKALLAQGLPIKEVAARVGFDDPFYFMRVFRRTAGMPAGRFQASPIATAEPASP